MGDVLKADIFFFVTTIAVAVVSAALVAVLVYALLILRDVKNISSTVREESSLLSDDIKELRGNIKKEGAKLKHFLKFFGTIYKRNAKRKRAKNSSP